MKFLFVGLALMTAFAFAERSSAAQNFTLNLECEGSQTVATQPCGGVNSRRLDLQSNLYQESRSYGGCYSTSDAGFGIITNLQSSVQTVSFTLVRKGSFNDNFPVATPDENEEMKATLDLDKNQLTLDTSEAPWFYQSPSVLACHARSSR